MSQRNGIFGDAMTGEFAGGATGWRPCVEMAAAMIAPTIAVIVIGQLGAIEGLGLLMTIELAAMFAVMVARPGEYSHRCSGAGRTRR